MIKKSFVELTFFLISILLPIGIIFYIANVYLPNGLLNWDAEHYFYIANYGYEGFRVAFFPMFPKVWGILGSNVYNIVIINLLLYFMGLYLLSQFYKFSRESWLIFVFGPSTIFFNLPYTESFFFLWCSLLLFGICKKLNFVILFSLLLISITRPSFTILIIAITIYGVLSRKYIEFVLYPILISIIGIIIVSIIQYYDTGLWFEFFNAQKLWGNELQIPRLPFKSWGGGVGGNPAIIDGLALILGFTFGCYSIFFNVDYKTIRLKSDVNSALFISNIFLLGTSLSVLLFRGGSLFSLNRFFFCVPFFIISLDYFLSKLKTLNKNWFWFIMLGLVVYYLLLFESYKHLTVFLRFSVPPLILALVYYSLKTRQIISRLLLIIIAFLLGLIKTFFLYQFLKGEWIA